MSGIGYQLINNQFLPSDEIQEPNDLQCMMEELSLQKDLLSQGRSASSLFKFADATEVLCKNFGVKCNPN